MLVDINTALEILKNSKNVLILTHKNPDGDTLGSAYSLCYGLLYLGKKAKVVCNEKLPKKFEFMLDENYPNELEQDFDLTEFDTIISVDIADPKLLGERLEGIGDKIDLVIDHHPSNTMFGKNTYLVDKAAATCEIIFDILNLLDIKISQIIADCLYTGLATDTGCFRFSNTSSKTHLVAAALIELNCKYKRINEEMFEKKSRARILLEQYVLNSIEFFYEDKCAIVEVSKDVMTQLNVKEEEFDGVSAIPRQIEGVSAGITFKENDIGYKISVRTDNTIDASMICQSFGGGGHKRAAGCVISENFETAKKMMLDRIKQEIFK